MLGIIVSWYRVGKGFGIVSYNFEGVIYMDSVRNGFRIGKS